MPGEERKVIIVFANGVALSATEGETVAAALLKRGILTFRRTIKLGAPRSIFCGMGICFDCTVFVDGRPIRACLSPVWDGMQITFGDCEHTRHPRV